MFPQGMEGDLACFACGFVTYAIPPLAIEDLVKRERRPSRGGVPL